MRKIGMMEKSNLKLKYGMAVLFTLLVFSSSFAKEVTVTVSLDKPQWVVSEYLTGTHFVYAYEADWIYEDKTVIDWMKRAKVGVIRYPGGTVTMCWHWDDLNGYAFPYHAKELTGTVSPVDTWSPEYIPLPKRDPKDYMDVDEYMAVCKKVGAKAMLGLNILSGKKSGRPEESKAEARRLTEYCKKRGYDVPFWYIGNEGYAMGIWGKEYAKAIDEYAAIVKQAYPKAQIIADWKYGPREKKRFEESLKLIQMSKAIDIMEYHEKWGDDWGLYSGITREEWLEQKPFLYKGQFSEFYQRFNEQNRTLGREVKHAHNEWGLGGMKGSKGVYDFTLLTADFFIELFRHPTYMASGWNLNMGPKDARIFLAEHGKVRLMPPALVYEMVATAMGNHLIPIQVEGCDAVYGFAVNNAATKWTQLYLINKSEATEKVRLAPKGLPFAVKNADRLVAPGKITIEAFTDVPETIELMPMSFTRIAGSSKPLSH
jgi:alpha-L-arabinofuranosidase